ncbi:MAG: sugar transferase [Candidatus Omnitrophica bacterium]|nr:sugar transferase [Candidatus Omnitrophota bacterium]
MRDSRQDWIIHSIYVVADIVCIYAAIYLVMLLRHATLPFAISWEGFFSSANPFKIVFFLWVPVILFFNQTHGLYQTRREMFESLEIWQVIKSVALSTLVAIVLVYLLKIQDFPRGILIFSAAALSVLLSVWRVLKKLLVNFLVEHGYNNFNAVIIGAGKIGVLLADEIKKQPALGIKVIGFLDDEKEGLLGKLKDFESIAQREFIRQIFITIHPDYQVFIKLLETARELNIAVRVVPQGYEYIAQDFIKYNIGIVPILEYSDIDVNYRQKGKRIFDFLVSLLLMILLLPFFILLMILIKLDSPGPVFYNSKRYGHNARMFSMYKFRSMVINADELLGQLKDKNEVDGPIFKIKRDPRTTPMGTFLRRYSLDELPQIFNVLKGDMSLVGPRPFPIAQVEKEDLRQLRRLGIRPGITGLWQIKGRSDVSFDKLLRWDIWYINNWSFWLDLYILFKTFPVVIKGKGAY